ncbi:POT family-domain-containing protein [Penicillium verhagenii]|uniref:POT family-domain-containing protein n=1 Tax=Penicillium verhagenii TaxID=1562060 RepID=UPI0025451CC7|nr:POT family-domain-containing protein [Penicillium verhagenii]KAJ5938296.1 POT family-domain-containing protein [Penicillium verhagenii]
MPGPGKDSAVIVNHTANSTFSSDERHDATEDEIRTLQHVPDDKLPRTVWIALAISAAERFTFWAITTPWQNYMQNSPDSAIRGALGLGQSTATNISNAFSLFYSLVPIPISIVSDAWLGRYKTLWISIIFYLCGCLVQLVTSLPIVLDQGGGILGLAIAMFLIGIGLGGVRSTISPFIGDQYPVIPTQVKMNKNGERVIIDRTLTLQYIYNVAYWLLNIAGLSVIPSTFLEKKCGFWAANLLAFGAFWIIPILLLAFNNQFVKTPVQRNVLINTSKVLACSARSKFKIGAARPQYQLEKHNRIVSWSDHFVTELQIGLLACRVMAWFVIFYLGISQISNNLISQAGQMQLTGFPNDVIQILNPIACIILGPLIQNYLYPSLNRYRISFGPIARMAVALLTMAASMAYAAGVQKLIYSRGPCYDNPLKCPAALLDPTKAPVPNNIVVWVQAPTYVLLAVSEILGFATLSEYSYNKAPRHLRTVVQAMRQVTAAVSYALGMALSPVSENPKVLWMYVGIAASLVLIGVAFWVVMGHYDRVDEDLNTLNLKSEESGEKVSVREELPANTEVNVQEKDEIRPSQVI